MSTICPVGARGFLPDLAASTTSLSQGVEVVSRGSVTEQRPGRVLRSGVDTETVSLDSVRRSPPRR